MPAAFSEAERDVIRRKLLEIGRTLFTSVGLRKTTLEDLVGPAGIVKSSFYSFFDSKEALYLELLAQEAPAVEKRVLPPLTADLSAREAIEQFLTGMMQVFETNSLTRRLLTHPEELAMVARRVKPAEMEAKMERSTLPILAFVERGQARGELVAGRPEVIVGVIRAVTFLSLHREQIGEQIYPDVVAMMIRTVAAGLTKEVHP